MLLLVSSVSCTKQNLSNENQGSSSIAPDIEIIQERDQEYPWDPDMFENNFLRTRNSAEQTVAPSDYAGRVWSLRYFPVDNPENAGIKVIDVDSYIKQHDGDALIDINLRKTATIMFTFADYDRLLTKTDYSTTVSTGSSFSLFGIKAGANLDFNTTFGEETERETQNVYGYFEYRYDGMKYTLVLPDVEYEKKFIAAQYTSDDFKWALSSYTPQSFVNKFGAYLLTNYLTGGKANIEYLGRMTNTSSSQSSEDAMEIAMSATLGSLGSSNVKFEYDAETYKKVESKFQSVRIATKSIGGDPNHNAASVTPINQFSVDFSDWAKTLTDYSKHTVTKIYPGGLIPLSDFVLERNLKNMFAQIYRSESVPDKQFVEPVIEVTKGGSSTALPGLSGIPEKWSVRFTLTTRYGDKLVLAKLTDVSKEEADRFMAEKCTEFKEIFGTKIVSKAANSLLIDSESTGTDIPVVQIKNKYIYFGVNYMSKYTTPSGVTYLVYDSPDESKVYVYTVHDDFVKYAYGLYEFIDTLPEKELNFTQATSDSKYVFNAL